jgi:hypothetical protein
VTAASGTPVPRHPEMLPEPFGWELVMDLHGCDPAVIGSRRALRRYRNAGQCSTLQGGG